MLIDMTLILDGGHKLNLSTLLSRLWCFAQLGSRSFQRAGLVNVRMPVSDQYPVLCYQNRT